MKFAVMKRSNAKIPKEKMRLAQFDVFEAYQWSHPAERDSGYSSLQTKAQLVSPPSRAYYSFPGGEKSISDIA